MGDIPSGGFPSLRLTLEERRAVHPIRKVFRYQPFYASIIFRAQRHLVQNAHNIPAVKLYAEKLLSVFRDYKIRDDSA